jgi:hypothetical protein
MTPKTPLASVFAQGRYVGAIQHRGPKGYEAVTDDAVRLVRDDYPAGF